MTNQGGGAKCVNLFLFVATIMFIIDNSMRISELKAENTKVGYGRYDFTIECQTRVLTWISLSFCNYYAFLVVTFCIISHSSERESHKKFRFKTSLLMAFVLIPFMISWNIYGNVMIKQEYFKGPTQQQGTSSPSSPSPSGQQPDDADGNGGTLRNSTSTGGESVPMLDPSTHHGNDPQNGTSFIPNNSSQGAGDTRGEAGVAPNSALHPNKTFNETGSVPDDDFIPNYQPFLGIKSLQAIRMRRSLPALTASDTEDPSRPYSKTCDLDTWYQMLSILYMLLIYCQFIVYFIFFCSFLSYMKRFFQIVDEMPSQQQRRMPVSEGGRGHPLLRRTFFEYMHGFDYAYYLMSRGRVNRQAELRYLSNYKNQIKVANQVRRLRSVTYKEQKPVEEEEELFKKVFDEKELEAEKAALLSSACINTSLNSSEDKHEESLSLSIAETMPDTACCEKTQDLNEAAVAEEKSLGSEDRKASLTQRIASSFKKKASAS